MPVTVTSSIVQPEPVAQQKSDVECRERLGGPSGKRYVLIRPSRVADWILVRTEHWPLAVLATANPARQRQFRLALRGGCAGSRSRCAPRGSRRPRRRTPAD